ncbi:DUF3099 domain-containing protein [Kocuria sp.]|uniref:DUF3099 domain-containing protein n=1 Tax=Kocuria sp. TaxID=1871328 RepID=UPI0026DC99DE|nr:DUF3099 domain-containing protein [Kocuria sp.]MDO4919702.1 DUF3099 domain-containing protein [Kocuria sp.]
MTSAADPHTADISHRMKVYSAQMAVRIVCIIGAILIDNIWVRVLLVLGAALLPWFAVMLANKGADRSERTGSAYRPPTLTELPTTAETRDRAPEPEAVVVDGEYTVHAPQRALPVPRPTASRRN